MKKFTLTLEAIFHFPENVKLEKHPNLDDDAYLVARVAGKLVDFDLCFLMKEDDGKVWEEADNRINDLMTRYLEDINTKMEVDKLA